MNYYILPIVINDRREITLPLVAGGVADQAAYIVEVPENVHFNVFSLLKDAEIKSLIPDTTDLPIGRLSPVYSLEDDHLTVSFNVHTNRHTNNEPESVTSEEEKPPALTYDDLDAYVPKKKAS